MSLIHDHFVSDHVQHHCTDVFNTLVDENDQLRAELEKSNQLMERLRRDLADPPIDVQEIIIKKMHLVSEDELEKVKQSSVDDFIDKLITILESHGIDATNWDGDEEPHVIVAGGIVSAVDCWHSMAQELCEVLDAILPLSPAVIKFQKMENEK